MFDVNVFAIGPDGEDLSFERICNVEELSELKKCYDNSDLSVKEIPNAKMSQSNETCFCPYCMRMEFIKNHHFVGTCKACGQKYYVNS